MPYTPAQQKATMKWRMKNKEKYNDYQAIQSKKFRDKDIVENRCRSRKYYAYKVESIRFRNILISDFPQKIDLEIL